MKLILPGASGQIGRVLVRAFTRAGHTCVVLTRDPARLAADFTRLGLGAAARALAWDGRSPGAWCAELEDTDVVINLAGRSVNCRYTERNLAEMLASRVDATRAIGAAIAAAARPPRIWLNASTATIYAHAAPGDDARDESGPLGGAEPGMPAIWARSVEIGRAWERELFAADTPHTRRVALRSAMDMGPGRGGVFDAFAGLCRAGLGRHGDGTQFVSWIHEDDFVAALRFLIDREDLDGVVNLASPHPLPNREFVAALHTALGGRRPSLPMPNWLLEIGARLRGTETELLLKSRRVVPGRLLAAGFSFRHPDWPAAARDLVARWRRGEGPRAR